MPYNAFESPRTLLLGSSVNRAQAKVLGTGCMGYCRRCSSVAFRRLNLAFAIVIERFAIACALVLFKSTLN